MTNKRKHKRIPIAAVATVSYEEMDTNHSLQTMTGSISLGGVGVYSDSPIEDGIDVSVNIQFISTEGTMQTVTVEGRVVYNKKIGDMYFLGIQFDEEVTESNSPLLFKHIENALTWDTP